MNEINYPNRSEEKKKKHGESAPPDAPPDARLQEGRVPLRAACEPPGPASPLLPPLGSPGAASPSDTRTEAPAGSPGNPAARPPAEAQALPRSAGRPPGRESLDAGFPARPASASGRTGLEGPARPAWPQGPQTPARGPRRTGASGGVQAAGRGARLHVGLFSFARRVLFVPACAFLRRWHLIKKDILKTSEKPRATTRGVISCERILRPGCSEDREGLNPWRPGDVCPRGPPRRRKAGKNQRSPQEDTWTCGDPATRLASCRGL